MKQITAMLVIIALVASLSACTEKAPDTSGTPDISSSDPANAGDANPNVDPTAPDIVFMATVIETEPTLLVEPEQGSTELSSADRISVALAEGGAIQDADGNSTELAVGDRVAILYDGHIAESYPAQITASQVTLAEPINENPAT